LQVPYDVERISYPTSSAIGSSKDEVFISSYGSIVSELITFDVLIQSSGSLDFIFTWLILICTPHTAILAVVCR
jgi:hypothetical protein